MTKGIREFTSSRFMKLLPRAKDMGPRGFRRRVMDDVMKQFDISVASAATAYNHVLKTQREEDPKSVEGIGRAFQVGRDDDAPAPPAAAKRGPGRPPKQQPAQQPAQARGRGDAQPAAAQPSGDMVTVVKARDGAVVAQAIDRRLAKDLVAASAGRGRPKLVIKEDEEETADA